MPTELEAKIRIDDPDAVRRRTKALGLEAKGKVLERNRLFDTAEQKLLKNDSAIRIREEAPEGGKAGRAILTFKGPRRPDDIKRREEINVAVSDGDSAAALLEALGFRQSFAYQKRREGWRAGPCEVSLDELPLLGWFIEVEGPDEETIQETLASLGLVEHKVVPEDYIHLLINYLRAEGKDPTRAEFEHKEAERRN